MQRLESRVLLSGTPLLTPTNLKVIYNPSTGADLLTWTDPNFTAGTDPTTYAFYILDSSTPGKVGYFFIDLTPAQASVNGVAGASDQFQINLAPAAGSYFLAGVQAYVPGDSSRSSGQVLLNAAAPFPAPVLSATPAGSTIQLSWTSVPTAASYTVTNPTTGAIVTTTTATSYTDATAVYGQQMSYQVAANFVDSTGVTTQGTPSNVVTAMTVAPNTPLNFSDGFANAGSAITYATTGPTDTTPSVSGSNLIFTDPNPIVADSFPPDETLSALSTEQFSTSQFDTSFTFQELGSLGTSLGDEFAFVIGKISVPFDFGINESIYPTLGYNDTTGIDNSSSGQNTVVDSTDLSATGINPRSGDPLRVNLQYNGSILTESVTDQTTAAVFSTSYAIDIAAVDGPQAAVGFTALTGQQEIVPPTLVKTTMYTALENWTFTPAAVTPVKLTGTPIGTVDSWAPGSTINQVFDGNFNTFYDPSNGNLGHWVGLDLGSPQTITQIKFAPRAGYEFRMAGGQFQVSNTADFSSGVQTIYTVTTAPTAGQFTTVAVDPAGAYRYVRYIGGNQWVNIAEMEVDGLPPVPAKLAGTPIGTAAVWSPLSTAAQAFDGNFSTFFDPATGNLADWAGLDLGSPQTITQLKFAPRAGYEFRMVGGQFQVSSTADFSSDVHTIYTVTTAPAAGKFTVVPITAAGAYRYVRYTGGNQWVNIAEMEVDGVYVPPSMPGQYLGVHIGTTDDWSPTSTINQVFDGNFNTFFDPATGSLNHWVGLDLGRASTITQISFAPRAGYEFRMVGGEFQVSNTPDFSSGVLTIYTVATAPVAGQFTTISVSVPGKYRYIRYTGGNQWVNIAEMQVDGPG